MSLGQTIAIDLLRCLQAQGHMKRVNGDMGQILPMLERIVDEHLHAARQESVNFLEWWINAVHQQHHRKVMTGPGAPADESDWKFCQEPVCLSVRGSMKELMTP